MLSEHLFSRLGPSRPARSRALRRSVTGPARHGSSPAAWAARPPVGQHGRRGPARRRRNGPGARESRRPGASRHHRPARRGPADLDRRHPGADPPARRGGRPRLRGRCRQAPPSRPPDRAPHRRGRVGPQGPDRRRGGAAHRPRGEDGGRELAPRSRRQHPDGASRPCGQGPPLPPGRQARVSQPRWEREGPAGGRDGRSGRARGIAQAGIDDRRGHLGQHRGRARDRGRPAPLPLRLRHARQDGPREDRPAPCLWRRSRAVPVSGGARSPRLVLLGDRSARRGDPGRVPSGPVPQPREPCRPREDDRS